MHLAEETGQIKLNQGKARQNPLITPNFFKAIYNSLLCKAKDACGH